MKFVDSMLKKTRLVKSLMRELEHSVQYHERYTTCIDNALGKPRQGTHLINCHLNAIMKLNEARKGVAK